ncbi:MAG: phosphoribosylaminoimidazolesuccinocarboxamide synthase, partial [Anaerovoracaceae bacterium]
MDKREQIYEGKAKIVYATEDPDYCIVRYKDDATAFNGLKKGTIAGKGAVNNRVTNHLMHLLESRGIPTHYVRELDDRETLVKRVRIIPLEVIVRNLAAGSMAKRLGLEEGLELKKPVLEFSYKNDELGDPMVNEDHILALAFAT